VTGALGEVTLDRAFVVAWSRPVRNLLGDVDHHETGLRFL
jgi:hypothetical protein